MLKSRFKEHNFKWSKKDIVSISCILKKIHSELKILLLNKENIKINQYKERRKEYLGWNRWIDLAEEDG